MEFKALAILILLLNNFALHQATQSHVPSQLKSSKNTCTCHNPVKNSYNGHDYSKIIEQDLSTGRYCQPANQYLLDNINEIMALISKIVEDLNYDKLIVTIDLMDNGKHPYLDDNRSKFNGNSNLGSMITKPHSVLYSLNEDSLVNSFKCPAEFKNGESFKNIINPMSPLKSSTMKPKNQHKNSYNTYKVNNTDTLRVNTQPKLRRPS